MVIRSRLKSGILLNIGLFNSLSIRHLVLETIINPLLTILFFVLLSSQSDIFNWPNAFLFLLLAPVGIAIFAVGRVFQTLKDRRLVYNIMITPNGIASCLAFSILPDVIKGTLFSTLVVSLVAVSGTYQITLVELVYFLCAYLLCTLSCSLFGLCVSLVSANMKSTLVLTNTLFYMLIATSGIYSFERFRSIEYIGYLNPLYYNISFVKELLEGNIELSYLLASLILTAFYFVIMLASTKYAETRLMKGSWTA